MGAKIRAFDPEGMDEAKQVLKGIDYADDAYGVAQGAGALVLVTEWNAFRSLDLKRISDAMAGNVFVDLRNVYAEKRSKELRLSIQVSAALKRFQTSPQRKLLNRQLRDILHLRGN
jgi:UDP-N-acetyl-D-mannosaminuronate dehydrogenase